MYPLDYKKIEELRRLADIPLRDGEQFISVYLNLTWAHTGYIAYGFKWKNETGERDFHSLDEAIKIVADLRRQANMHR